MRASVPPGAGGGPWEGASSGAARPGLDVRLRHLCSLAVLVVLGRRDELPAYLRAAVAAGVPPDLLRELLLQTLFYCGWPRALEGFETLDGVMREGKGIAPEPIPSALPGPAVGGAEYFDRVYGKDAEKVRARLVAHHPLLAEITADTVYDRVLSRPALSPRMRECLAVAMLAALGSQRAFLGHLRGAIAWGARPAVLREILSQVTLHLPDLDLSWAFDLVAHAAGEARAPGT